MGAPQSQQRASYPSSADTIRFVVLTIDARGGPVLLANGMRMSRLAQSPHVLGANFRWKDFRRRAPLAQRVIDDSVRTAVRMRSGSGSG
jgi:hypothetical protein